MNAYSGYQRSHSLSYLADPGRQRDGSTRKGQKEQRIKQGGNAAAGATLACAPWADRTSGVLRMESIQHNSNPPYPRSTPLGVAFKHLTGGGVHAGIEAVWVGNKGVC